MNNREVAAAFTLIANLLEIKGEVIYTTLAYRRAAESLLSLAGDVNQFWKEEKLREIPGVGKSIAEKIDELLRTGSLGYLQELEKAVPPGLADWLQVSGLGPKKARGRGGRTRLLHADLLKLADLDVRAEASRLFGVEATGADLERRSRAGRHSLPQRLLRRPPGRVGCDVRREQDVSAADTRHRLYHRRRRPVTACLAPVAEPGEAAALVRNQDVPSAELGDVLECEREILPLVELRPDQRLRFALVR